MADELLLLADGDLLTLRSLNDRRRHRRRGGLLCRRRGRLGCRRLCGRRLRGGRILRRGVLPRLKNGGTTRRTRRPHGGCRLRRRGGNRCRGRSGTRPTERDSAVRGNISRCQCRSVGERLRESNRLGPEDRERAGVARRHRRAQRRSRSLRRVEDHRELAAAGRAALQRIRRPVCDFHHDTRDERRLTVQPDPNPPDDLAIPRRLRCRARRDIRKIEDQTTRKITGFADAAWIQLAIGGNRDNCTGPLSAGANLFDCGGRHFGRGGRRGLSRSRRGFSTGNHGYGGRNRPGHRRRRLRHRGGVRCSQFEPDRVPRALDRVLRRPSQRNPHPGHGEPVG